MKNAKLLTKKCPNCGNEFSTYRSIDGIFCNRACAFSFQKKTTYQRKKKNCIICGHEFIPKHTKTPGLYCSYKCSNLRKNGRILRNGYIYLFLPEHPNATQQGYYAEHRYVMEKTIGRILDRQEIAHHINHDKTDNRIENLMLMVKREHSSLHIQENQPTNDPIVRKKISQSKIGNINWKDRKRTHEGKFI